MPAAAKAELMLLKDKRIRKAIIIKQSPILAEFHSFSERQTEAFEEEEGPRLS